MGVQWVVKVDADAIFVPHRLKGMLQGHPITYTGIYIENCNEVKWGFFGNLEVFSVEAFSTLLTNIDSCSQTIDWVCPGTKKRWGAKNATKWKPPCNLVGTPAIH